MNEPIRVLNIVGLMSPGGIETLIMNIYRNMDRTKVQFDFLTHKGIDGAFDEEIRKLGGKIYKMPQIRVGNRTYYFKFFQYILALKKFFKEHQEYRVIHGHMTNTAALYMPIARKYGNVTCCIAHSHLTQARPGFVGKLTNLLHKPLPKIATDYFACSKMAAEWIFKEEDINSGKVKIIKNGVDLNKFFYDKEKRLKIRKKLGLTNKYVIGNVARFKTEKNHTFQIEVFKKFHEINPDSILMLIGEGELVPLIKEKVKRLKLEDSVIFMGLRDDVPELMQAMDLFFLPSLYEGLPVVGIEAQATGLPVLTSTGVTSETDITGNVIFIDLNKGVDFWAKKLLDISKNFVRKNEEKIIEKQGYNIKSTAKYLQNFYLNKHNKKNTL